MRRGRSCRASLAYIYLYVYIHIYVYIYIERERNIHIYLYMGIYIYIYVYIHMYVYTHSLSIYLSLSLYIYTYIHTYIYTYISNTFQTCCCSVATDKLNVSVRSRTSGAGSALPHAPCGDEVLHFMCFRCLARNARCNTMSHLTADAACSYTSRAKRQM